MLDLANLKSNVDKLDVLKLKNVPSGLSNFKSNVDRLDGDILVPVPVDLSKLIDAVFYYQLDAENYNFLLFDRNEYLHMESSNLVSIFM